MGSDAPRRCSPLRRLYLQFPIAASSAAARAHVTLDLPRTPAAHSHVCGGQKDLTACLSSLPRALVASLDVRLSIGSLASLWRLTALQRLQLSCASCAGSWSGLAALTRLHHLSVFIDRPTSTTDPYRDLPNALAALSNLRCLNIEACNYLLPMDPIRSRHLQTLTKLEQLRLVNAAYSADVAAALPALTALTGLCCHVGLLLDFTRVQWEQLGSLTALRELELSHCHLRRLPAALVQLTALTRLHLSSGLFNYGNLWELAPLSALRQLQHLNLSWCGLAGVPQQLAALTQLTQLSLEGNRLMGVAARGQNPSALAPLAALQQLQHINLSYCGLASLPEQLSALAALTCLDLAGNSNLAGGWQHLRPLTRLRQLGLWRVPLPDGVPPGVAALPRCRALAVPESGGKGRLGTVACETMRLRHSS